MQKSILVCVLVPVLVTGCSSTNLRVAVDKSTVKNEAAYKKDYEECRQTA